MNNTRMRGFLTLAVAVVGLALVGSAFATPPIMPPTGGRADSGLLFGQHHSYSVIFRGNGEAVVYGRMAFTNNSSQPQTDFTFSISGVNPSDLVVFQQILPPRCTRYDYPKTGGQTCVEWQDPNYSQNYYYENGQAKYFKIDYKKVGESYLLQLPVGVQPDKSGAFLLAYAARGYVKNQLGLFKFTFTTPTVDARVENIKVSVDVDSDLALRGKTAQVNYFENSGLKALSAPAGAGGGSPALDQVSQQIGGYAPIMKEAKSLAPGDSFKVTGEYAQDAWRLYVGQVIWALVILAVLIGIVIWLIKRPSPDVDRPAAEVAPVFDNAGTTTDKVAGTKGQASTGGQYRHRDAWLNLFNLGMSLLSAALVVGLVLFTNWFAQANLMQMFYGNQVIAALVMVVIGLLFILVMLGPALIALGHNHGGWRALVSVLIGELIWLVILLVIYGAIFGIITGPRYYPMIYNDGVQTNQPLQ